MGFFAPWFLAGIAAVGLPVWIHLLKKHRTDPRLFPSLMLFEKREQSSVKHRCLDHIVLFILRAAMLILLALLFANPFIRLASKNSDSNKLTVIAVDHSFSMRAGDRLARAKEQALGVVADLKQGARAQVIALGGTVQALTQPTSDPGELRAAINSIEPSDSRASFGELARYTRTLAESIKTPIELDLASDLQKSAMPPGFIDLRLDPGTTLVLHQVGQGEQNWAVENVIAPRRVYDPKKVRIDAVIAGYNGGQTVSSQAKAPSTTFQNAAYTPDGEAPPQAQPPGAKRTVSLLLNGKVLQTKSVEVPSNGRAQVEFLGLDAPYGFSRGEVRIDSADILAADDRFPFAVERTDPRRVLYVDDGRGGRAQLYFRAALESGEDSAFQMDAARPEQAAAMQLPRYAFIVLSNLGALPPGFEDTLTRYVSAGGSLLVALGPASAVSPRVPVLDEAIQSAAYAGREDERFLTVSD
ncbi:MAG: BatA domain-containing protein, partial [Bryobacteraceae bacterium]